MKILVTGAQGQLARSIVERGAMFSDLEIVALGRPRLDLTTPGSASDAITAFRPHIVINTAGYTNVDKAEEEPELAFRLNAGAAEEIASAAARIRAPIFQLSTDYVFNGESAAPYTEEDCPDPLGVYGQSKLLGEERVRDANKDHLVVRTAWVYSPFGKNFVKMIMAAARERDVLTVVEDQTGSPTSALDLADGLLEAARLEEAAAKRSSGFYHLAGSGSTSWYGLARFVMEECAKHRQPLAEVRPITTGEWPTRARRPRSSVLNSRKFTTEFGFAMPMWTSSVGAVIERLAAADGSEQV